MGFVKGDWLSDSRVSFQSNFELDFSIHFYLRSLFIPFGGIWVPGVGFRVSGF